MLTVQRICSPPYPAMPPPVGCTMHEYCIQHSLRLDPTYRGELALHMLRCLDTNVKDPPESRERLGGKYASDGDIIQLPASLANDMLTDKLIKPASQSFVSGASV